MIILKEQGIPKEFLEADGDAVIIGSKHVLIGKKNIYDTTKNNVLIIGPGKTGKDYGITYPTIVEGWKGNKIILDMQKKVSGSIGKFLREESSVWTFYPGDERTLKYNPFENIDFEKENCKEKIKEIWKILLENDNENIKKLTDMTLEIYNEKKEIPNLSKVYNKFKNLNGNLENIDFLLEGDAIELLSKNEVDLKRIMDSAAPRNFFFGCDFYNNKTLKKWNRILKILLHQFSEYSKERGNIKEVLLILTEPFELGKIEDFAEKIKIFNENNVRVFIAFNSVNQIEKVYGKEAKEILDLFGTKVFFAPEDNETAKYISTRIGTKPVADHSWFLKTASVKEKIRFALPENLRKLSCAKEVVIIRNSEGHKNVFICNKNLLMDKYFK